MTQSEALVAFVEGALSVDELRRALSPDVRFSESEDGSLSVEYSTARRYPHVTFSREQVAAMLDRVISGEISLDEVSQWANHMTLLDFFDLTRSDDDPDCVWEVLSRLAHPEQSGADETWKLRNLRDMLADRGVDP